MADLTREELEQFPTDVSHLEQSQYGALYDLALSAQEAKRLLAEDRDHWNDTVKDLGESEAQVARLREDLDRLTRGSWSKELALLSRANARLREALEYAAGRRREPGDWPRDISLVAEKALAARGEDQRGTDRQVSAAPQGGA
jgi:hypothetical protein